MNSYQAKKLSLPDILNRLGYTTIRIKKNGNEYWYCSPFRNEKEASFHTSFLGGQWIWNDFGDVGGTVIDFIVRHENTNVKGALVFLENLYRNTNYKISRVGEEQKKMIVNEDSNAFQLIKIESLNRTVKYLKERGINLDVARKHLQEIYYRNLNNQKKYFAIGLKNNYSGYEIRNPYFKGSIGKKGYSFIEGVGAKDIRVFEGFMDFLSALTLLREQLDNNFDLNDTKDSFQDDVIILNSAAFKTPVIDFIDIEGYHYIFTYFDNDKAGKDLTIVFKQKFSEQVIPQNYLYESHNDYNEFLMAQNLK